MRLQLIPQYCSCAQGGQYHFRTKESLHPLVVYIDLRRHIACDLIYIFRVHGHLCHSCASLFNKISCLTVLNALIKPMNINKHNFCHQGVVRFRKPYRLQYVTSLSFRHHLLPWKTEWKRLPVILTESKIIMTSSNGNILRITGPLSGKFTCHR